MFTIDIEAKKNKLMPLSLDFMGTSYKNVKGNVTFPSPLFWLLEKNLFFLTAKSIKKKFDLKYIMRPDYLSFDEYGTVILAPLLMYVNGVFCIEEFNLNEVIVPKISYISEILVDKFPELSSDDLEVVNW
jgi:hypothetical protein